MKLFTKMANLGFLIFFSSLNILAQSTQQPFYIKLNQTAISPNADGKKDSLFITLDRVMENLENPLSWECEIIDSEGSRIFFFRSDMRLKRTSASIQNLFLPNDDNIEPVRLFDRLHWEGRNSKGRIVPDGIYRVRVHIVESTNSKIWTHTSQAFYVDTVAPKITLMPRISYIYPDKTGLSSGSKLVLIQSSQSQVVNTRFVGQLYNFDDELIYETKWENELPSIVNIKWKDISNFTSVIGGRFRYRLLAEDKAGNKTIVEYRDLIVADRFLSTGVSSKAGSFSPNNDGIKDTMGFTISKLDSRGISGKSGGYSHILFQVLSTKDGNVVFQKKAAGNLPQHIEWDGYDRKGELLPEGTYYARVILNGASDSLLLPFKLDTTAQSGSIVLNQTSFSPEYDGKDEFIHAQLNFENIEVASWQVALVLKPDFNDSKNRIKFSQKVYKFYNGKTGPVNITWDGYSDEGYEPASYEKFVFIYEITDRAGNKYIDTSADIQTGLLFRPIRKGSQKLIMRLPLQGYFNDNSSLTNRGQSVLEDIVSQLKYYGLYKISFEIHSSSPGKEEINLVKTEKRAWSMNNYLKKIWNSTRPYKYRGFGETELIHEKDDDFNHYRNERIEVQLSL